MGVCVNFSVVILVELIPKFFYHLMWKTFTFTQKLVLINVPVFVAEWDLGGFPAWLLAVKPRLRLRTSDPAYLKLVSY